LTHATKAVIVIGNFLCIVHALQLPLSGFDQLSEAHQVDCLCTPAQWLVVAQ